MACTGVGLGVFGGVALAGGVGKERSLAHVLAAMLLDVYLHVHTCLMLGA